jgi:hypothetical protein
MNDKAALVIKRSTTARRVSLRLDSRGGHFILTLPRGISQAAGLDFARSQQDWMTRALGALPQRLPFLHNTEVPLLGVPHRIDHDPAKPARVAALSCAEGFTLSVGGPEAGLEIRLLNWLRKQAKAELALRATRFSSQLGLKYGKLSIGDPKSRWGSCSARAGLSFSWRLILTPNDVMDYVVAHEVAHLQEMNHSPAFWKIVRELKPDYEKQRRWLKTNAMELARYGPKKTEAAAAPSSRRAKKTPPVSLLGRLFGR